MLRRTVYLALLHGSAEIDAPGYARVATFIGDTARISFQVMLATIDVTHLALSVSPSGGQFFATRPLDGRIRVIPPDRLSFGPIGVS
jgi:hypothetical protein